MSWILRPALCLWLVLEVVLSGSFGGSALAQADNDVALKKGSYPIAEIYSRDPEDTSPESPLAEFIFVHLLAESESPELSFFANWRQTQARSLGEMRGSFERFGRVVNGRKKVSDEIRNQHLQYLVDAERAYHRQKDVEDFIEGRREAGELDDGQYDELLAEIEKYRETAHRIASEVLSLREAGLLNAKQAGDSMSPEDYQDAVDKNKIFYESGIGRAEINTIDSKTIVRVLHRDLEISIPFLNTGEVDPRSSHLAKYIASQHINSGKGRNDGVRGRHVAIPWMAQNESGHEVIHQVRFHPQNAAWSLSWEEWKNFRKDNFLFLQSQMNWKQGAWGLGAGFFQGTILYLMDKTQIWQNIPDAEIRWDVILFSVGFSTFWGIFQPHLRKFTNNHMLTNTEKTLRRILATGIPFNAGVILMTYGRESMDMTTTEGWFHWASLSISLVLSNQLKIQLEKFVAVLQRLRLNTNVWKFEIPSWMIPWPKTSTDAEEDAKFQALPSFKFAGFEFKGLKLPRIRKNENDAVKVDSGTKIADLQLRGISLGTSTIRVADLSNIKLVIPGIGMTVPLGKLIQWAAIPFAMHRSMRSAEKKGSDLAPEYRAEWETWMKPILTFQVWKPSHPLRSIPTRIGKGLWSIPVTAKKMLTGEYSQERSCREHLRRSLFRGGKMPAERPAEQAPALSLLSPILE